MAVTVTLAGVNYSIPNFNDAPSTGWGNSLTNFFIAVAANIATSPAFMQTVVVTTSPQTVVSAKTYLVTTSSIAITLNLPAPTLNAWFIVKDISQNAFTNNITLHRNGTELIDGIAADFVISASNAAWIFMSDGTNWYSVASVGDLVFKDIVSGNSYRIFMRSGVLSEQRTA